MRPSEALKNVEPVADLDKWANRQDAAQKAKKRAEEEKRKWLAPVGSLMFTEVERRMDVVIFRTCFAHSVYEARRMVIHGDVLLNGKKVRLLVACTETTSPDPFLAYEPEHASRSWRHGLRRPQGDTVPSRASRAG